MNCTTQYCSVRTLEGIQCSVSSICTFMKALLDFNIQTEIISSLVMTETLEAILGSKIFIVL